MKKLSLFFIIFLGLGTMPTRAIKDGKTFYAGIAQYYKNLPQQDPILMSTVQNSQEQIKKALNNTTTEVDHQEQQINYLEQSTQRLEERIEQSVKRDTIDIVLSYIKQLSKTVLRRIRR